MKICSNCGNKISDNEKKCLVCKTSAKNAISVDENDKERIDEIVASVRASKSNSKPKKKSKFMPIILAVILLAIIGSIFGGEDDVQKTGAPVSSNQVSASEGSQNNVVGEKIITEVGQSITTKNFIVTLEAINKLAGNDFNKPADGKEFTEVILVIENISDKDYNVSSIIMFNAYEDGYSINESFSAHIISDISTMDGALAAGKKLRGKLAYELSEDWKEIEVDIDLTALTFSTDGKIKVILQNQ